MDSLLAQNLKERSLECKQNFCEIQMTKLYKIVELKQTAIGLAKNCTI